MATTTFNDLITFSRGSNATVTGPNGLIQWAPSNLLTNSESFEASAWQKLNAVITAITVTPNTEIAPDGSRTADTFVVPAGTGSGYAKVFQQITGVAGPHTSSVWLKGSVGGETVQLITVSNGSTYSYTLCTLTTQWQRFSVLANNTTAGNAFLQIGYESTGSGPNITGGTIYVWGAQLELGSTATTYNNTSVRNLQSFGESFDNPLWTKTATSVVTGAQANPVNGLFNAQKLMENTANTQHAIFATTTVPSGITMTLSMYVKPAGRNFVSLYPQGASTAAANYDLLTGTSTNGAVVTNLVSHSIQNVGSGWFRCSITFVTTGVSLNSVLYLRDTTGSTSAATYTGDGNSGVYIYGAQLSNSASLDPYVPTPGAAPSSTAYYGPRFDYDPVTLLPRGLLVEEARTNLALQSEAITTSPWTFYNGANGAVIASIVSPSGAVNAIGLNDTSASGYYGVSQTVNISTSTTYTFSTYVKQGTNTTGFSVWLIGNNSNTFVQNTISWTGGVPTSGGWTATNAGNGWWRISYTFSSSTSTNVAVYLLPAPTTLSEVGSSYFWGAQLEAGAFATSYIPTIASTVTRSADVATITGSLFSQWYSQNEGGLIAEISSFGIGSNLPTFVNVSDGTTSNYIRFNGASGYLSRNFVASGGSTVANITVGAGLAANTPIKAAVVYANNSFNVAASGATGTEDTSGAVPVAQNQMVMGNWFTSAGTFLNGHIRAIRYVPVRAADFQLQQVTT